MSDNGYSRFADSTIQLAESGLVGKLEDKEKRRIKNFFSYIYHIDRYIDSRVDMERQETTEAIVRFLNGGIIPFCDSFSDSDKFVNSLLSIKSMIDGLGGVRRNEFVANVEKIFSCSETTRLTRMAGPFVAAREEEGRAMANLLLCVVDPMYNHPLFGEHFRALCAIGALHDSVVDYERDLQGGSIRIASHVVPELMHRMRYVGAGMLGDRRNMPDAVVSRLSGKLYGASNG